MLTRLYIDNYKCFSNFELALGPEHLFMGANGTGKTTVFEAIWSLRRFILGESGVFELFPDSSRTRWDKRSRQTFVLELESGSDRFKYRLEVDRDPGDPRARVHRESLHANDQIALVSESGEATFHGPASKTGRGFISLARSSLPLAPEGRFPQVEAFTRSIQSIWSVRADPLRMGSRSEGEESLLNPDLSNFSSWYRSANAERSEFSGRVTQSLQEIWDDFSGLRAVSAGEGVRILKAEWGPPASGQYALDELSEGQRALIGLYSVMHFLEGSDATLLLDEPDNFLALREVQPFLNAISEQDRLQRLIISHHPDVIDVKARASGISFERLPEGHVRASPFRASETPLTPSEIIARGWDDG